jgi:hypothetical protein
MKVWRARGLTKKLFSNRVINASDVFQEHVSLEEWLIKKKKVITQGTNGSIISECKKQCQLLKIFFLFPMQAHVKRRLRLVSLL